MIIKPKVDKEVKKVTFLIIFSFFIIALCFTACTQAKNAGVKQTEIDHSTGEKKRLAGYRSYSSAGNDEFFRLSGDALHRHYRFGGSNQSYSND